MKQPRPSLIGTPLLFIVACAELVAGDDPSGVHDCRLKAEKVEKVEKAEKAEKVDADRPEKPDRERAPAAAPKVVPVPAAPEPVRCDDAEPPPEPWDGTGRSEAVRGA